jgi:hypothetical protein
MYMGKMSIAFPKVMWKVAGSLLVPLVLVLLLLMMMIMMMSRRTVIMISLRVRHPKQPRKYTVVALNAWPEQGERYGVNCGFHINITG